MKSTTFDRFFKFVSIMVAISAVLTVVVIVAVLGVIGYSVATGKSLAPPIRIEVEHKESK